MKQEQTTTEQLIEDYAATKAAEDRLKEERRKLGVEIARRLGHPEEGSKTHTVGDRKVTVKGTIYRKVDWDNFDLACRDFSIQHPPCKVKRELDIKGIRYYKDQHPGAYAALMEAITEKPGAVQITIKEVPNG